MLRIEVLGLDGGEDNRLLLVMWEGLKEEVSLFPFIELFCRIDGLDHLIILTTSLNTTLLCMCYEIHFGEEEILVPILLLDTALCISTI